MAAKSHARIEAALRDAAMVPLALSGKGGEPDLLVGFRCLCLPLFVVEDLSEPMTCAQLDWIRTWPGPSAVVTTGEEAVVAVAAHARLMGRI